VKVERIMDSATAAALQMAWLIADLEPVSDYGRRVFETLEPFAPGQEAEATANAREIATAASALDPSSVDAIRETLRNAPDATGAIARAGMGDALSDVNFLELQRFCDAVERVRGLLAGAPVAAPPDCAGISRVLERGRSGKFGFYLGDDFDGDLATARAVLHAAQAEYDAALGRLRARIATALQRSDVSAGEFILMREDVPGPLPPGIHVIREAPTYYLCEIDLDESALAALGRRDAASERVAEVERFVRASLTAEIRRHAQLMEDAAQKLGAVDVLAAAIRFTQRHACRPAVYTNKPVVEFKNAHFLPLQAELERQGRNYVPITLHLAGPSVLTGPNMGGKSVALRTCGFAAACAAFGIPVPAENASVALFAHIAWLGIGTPSDGGGLLSSFAGEVVRLREVLAAQGGPALLLIDEFARTTTPEEGRALLLAVIARLRERNACAFIATHLWGIAADAQVPHFAVRGLRRRPAMAQAQNLDEALDALAKSMDYTIERVTADRESTADAIFLAGLLGLDPALIESAWQWIR
jgi:hypothetical protein